MVAEKALASARSPYYNSRMKHLVLASLVCVGSLSAVSAAPATAAVAPQNAETLLQAELASLIKNNSEDFYAAAAAVYDATGDVTAFYRMMQQQSDKGNAAAQLWYARHLQMKSATDKSKLAQAQKLLEKAAAAHYLPAMVDFAAQATLPTASDADNKRGMSVLMNACRRGSSKARALYLMVSGRMLNGGLTQPEIISELKKKNYYLEEMVANLQQNAQSRMVWMERAAENGSAFAPFMLFQMVPDAAKAEQYLQMATERHLPAALGHVGMVTTTREMVGEQNEEQISKGMRLLAISAMLNTPLAVQKLAYLYANGQGNNIPKERIVELFRLSHECGDPNGTAGVGYCMVLGAGCQQDVKTGLQYMEKARENGSNWVNQAFASMYFNGDGVQPDMRKAMDALLEDHLCGNRLAYTLMAVLTALGNDSAKPDPRGARLYLNMSMQNGDLHAQPRYELLLKEGKWRYMSELLSGKNEQ